MVGSGAVPLLALETTNKVALLVAAGLFIAFALAVSMVVPRYRPEFPGRGMGVFLLASTVFFAGTMGAMIVFGKEAEEAVAHGEAALTEEQHAESEPAETEPAVTSADDENPPEENAPATTNAGDSARTIAVSGTEFKFTLDSSDLGPGNYDFVFKNDGKVEHDLVIDGPNVDKARTPVIEPGEESKVRVALSEGSYELYCSVPGHEPAGMKLDLDVG